MKQRFWVALFPALLGPCQILLFGPHTIYSGNADEFTLSFWALLTPLVVMLFASAASLLVVALLVTDRLYPVYATLLFGLGLATWLEGNLLLRDYGPLDGTSIDWGAHPAGLGGQVALWIGLPILLALFGSRIVSQAATASGMLIVLQLLVLTVSPAQQAETGGGRRGRWRQPPERMFHFSTTQNIVHLILDGFQGDVFREIVEEDAALRRELDGFVFFADHAGAFPTTSMSIPAMLTGVAYRNEDPIKERIKTELERRSLFVTLTRNGYDVDFTSIVGNYFKGPITSRYGLPMPYASREGHRRAATALLFDLSLFRHVPTALKPRVYHDQEWLLQRQRWFVKDLSSSTRIYHSSNGRAFLLDAIKRMAVAQETPAYKLVHIGMPHYPVVLDGECRFTGVVNPTREAFVDQARCAVRTVGEFLDRLRELGIYDTSLILLTSDHGSGLESRGFVFDGGDSIELLEPIAGGANALLVVKRPGSSGALAISSAPSAITDIPATILDVMGLPQELPGTSVFRLDPTQSRDREYAHYEWANAYWRLAYLPPLEVYAIRGPLLKSSSWSLLRILPPPDSG